MLTTTVGDLAKKEKSKGPPAWPRYLWALDSLLLGSMAATPMQGHNCPGSQMVHRWKTTEQEGDL